MWVTTKHHLKVGRPVLTHGQRSTWCEKKARLLALSYLKWHELYIKICVCIKTFVRLHDFFILFSMFRNSVFPQASSRHMVMDGTYILADMLLFNVTNKWGIQEAIHPKEANNSSAHNTYFQTLFRIVGYKLQALRDLAFQVRVGRSFHQQGTVNKNVLERHVVPFCDGTIRCCSLTDLRLLEGM